MANKEDNMIQINPESYKVRNWQGRVGPFSKQNKKQKQKSSRC